MFKNILVATLAGLLVAGPVLAIDYGDEYEQPMAPDLSQIKSPELQRAILWACVLSVQPVASDCKWFSWAWKWVESHMPDPPGS
jgi:hypothetical protein